MERETGIEPATNSLEGCDSTTELLPPFDSLRSLRAGLRVSLLAFASPPPPTFFRACRAPNLLARESRGEKVGGEGRVRTSVARRRQIYSLLRLTTPPPPRIHLVLLVRARLSGSQCLFPLRPWATALKPAHVIGIRVSDVSLKGGVFPSMELAEGFEPPTG
jgi:hypothetical protein